MGTLLEGKHAIILGAGGSIGSAVAREFAAEGAEVFLAGRTDDRVKSVARAITAEGGRAHADRLDALDDDAVDAYVAGVIQRAGRLDAIFNATGPLVTEYGQGQHAVELSIEQFMLPLMTVLKAQFISARAAARHMIQQKSGVILFLTGSPARGHVPGATAIGTAFGAIETLAENMAVEVGHHGVRSVCVRTTTNIDSRTIQMTMDILASRMGLTKEQMLERVVGFNFLKAAATTTDTARVAAFLASDHARLFTGTVVNSTAGAALD
jgi:NAD(P)-dependent dehydrogenase (short-subunit alcohol dehydrogenase family)